MLFSGAKHALRQPQKFSTTGVRVTPHVIAIVQTCAAVIHFQRLKATHVLAVLGLRFVR